MNINIYKYLYNQHDSKITLFLSVSTVRSASRSTKGILRLSSAQRSLITMPDELKDLLVGILLRKLGDGHIVRRSSAGYSKLTYTQIAVSHKEYFDYVFSFFIPFCVEDYKPHIKQVRDYRTKKIYSSVTFTTMQLPCFNVFKDMFYLANVKKVPSNIYELLTPRGLAFLIMDDGSRQGSGLHLSVYAFTNEDGFDILSSVVPVVSYSNSALQKKKYSKRK
jgi:hypothetical protein